MSNSQIFKIHFKNGTVKKVPYEVVETLKNKLIEGCGSFQCFSIENKVVLIVNLGEVVFIEEEDLLNEALVKQHTMAPSSYSEPYNLRFQK